MSEQLQDITNEVAKSILEATNPIKEEVKSINEKEKLAMEEISKLKENVSNLEKESSIMATELKSYKDIAFRIGGDQNINANSENIFKEVKSFFLADRSEAKGSGRISTAESEILSTTGNMLGLFPIFADTEKKSESTLLRSDVRNRMGFNNGQHVWDGTIRALPVQISPLRSLATIKDIGVESAGMKIIYDDELPKTTQRKEAEAREKTSLTVREQIITPFMSGFEVERTKELIERSLTDIQTYITGKANQAFIEDEDYQFINNENSGDTTGSIRQGLNRKISDKNKKIQEIGLNTQGVLTRDDLYDALSEIEYGYNPVLILSRKTFFKMKKEKMLEHYVNTIESLPVNAFPVNGLVGIFENIPVYTHPHLDDLDVNNDKNDENDKKGLVGLVADLKYFEIGVKGGIEYTNDPYTKMTNRIIRHFFHRELCFGITNMRAFKAIMNFTK